MVEIYDVATDTWRQGPPIPTQRGWFGAALHDGRIYACGGKPDAAGSWVLAEMVDRALRLADACQPGGSRCDFESVLLRGRETQIDREGRHREQCKRECRNQG